MTAPLSQAVRSQETTPARAFSVALAQEQHEIIACQRLRYRVFVDELGADIHTDIPGLDRDRFDAHCRHLMVQNQNTGELVATTRILLDEDADAAGRFYSESEFELGPVRALNARLMEIGRTCIHPAYRKGASLAMLWHGIARLVELHQVDYLMGCASIPMNQGEGYVRSVLEHLRRSHYSPPELRVKPRVTLPRTDAAGIEHVALPTLLKGYLRLGALVCGEPCWDPDFRVADAFVLVNRDHLARRYRRHFLKQQ